MRFNPSILITRMRWIFGLILIVWVLLGSVSIPSLKAMMDTSATQVMAGKPVVLLLADKLDANEFFNSSLPGIRQLLATSTFGLMNIRSGVGYASSSSGFLTLGSGNRSIYPPDLPVNQRKNPRNISGDPRSYWEWSLGVHPAPVEEIVVPDIGWILNQSAEAENLGDTGLLGTVAHQYDWQTFLIGNGSTRGSSNLPAALLMMDRKGMIDGGDTGSAVDRVDMNFPYRFRFNRQRVMADLRDWMGPKRILAVDFGDFARLDTYRDEMLPIQYERVKQSVWREFDALLAALLTEWSPREATLIVLSPSISKEGISNKTLLAPVAIHNAVYQRGVLGSGTTNWPGLISNLDLLPTVLEITGLSTNEYLPGRMMKPHPESDPLTQVKVLGQKIQLASTNQRSLLDWYLGLISVSWIAAFLCFVLKYRVLGNWSLTVITLVPLVLLLMPGLAVIEGETGAAIIGLFLLISTGMALILALIQDIKLRFLIISAVSWLGIVLDQICGWKLIRFSALGYSATSGSRYYGIGNEYMGVFLGITLILAELIRHRTGKRWPVPVLLVISLFMVGWPQLGINFGGLLGALPGFTLYLFLIYNWRFNNRKTWLMAGLGLGSILLVGWWDSTRSIDLQTHIGRFFHLLYSGNLGPIWDIILRKLQMNLKLMANSPWARIIGLTILIGIGYRFILRRNLVPKPQHMVWYAILCTGIGILLANDSGVVALGTCLAYSFSFILIDTGKSDDIKLDEEPGSISGHKISRA